MDEHIKLLELPTPHGCWSDDRSEYDYTTDQMQAYARANLIERERELEGVMDCGECGAEDCELDFVECCGAWMCEDCRDLHDDKYPQSSGDK